MFIEGINAFIDDMWSAVCVGTAIVGPIWLVSWIYKKRVSR